MSYLGEGQDFRRQNLSSQSRVRDIENRFQREADINKFNRRMDDFTKFQAATGNRGNISGNVPKIGGNYMLAVREPQLTARQPTFREAGGDFMRGIGNFAQAFADKGPPILQLLKSAGQGISEFVNRPFQNMQNQNQMAGVERQVGFGSSELNDFNSLNISQQNTYNMLRGQGLSHAEAFGQARAQTMAMGGIATLQ
jgi:hypothetical protein